MKHIKLYLSIISVLIVCSSIYAQTSKRDMMLMPTKGYAKISLHDSAYEQYKLYRYMLMYGCADEDYIACIDYFVLTRDDETPMYFFSPPFRCFIDITDNIIIIGNPYALISNANTRLPDNHTHGVNVLLHTN